MMCDRTEILYNTFCATISAFARVNKRIKVKHQIKEETLHDKIV